MTTSRRSSARAGSVWAAFDPMRQALLTRAANAEAARQRAVQDKDWPRVASLEAELRQLWREHEALERQTERVA